MPQGEETKYDTAPDAFVANTLAMLKSPQILALADARMQLEAPELKGERPEITSSQMPRSYIFIITGHGKDPVYTQRYVDAVVASFIDFRVRQRDTAINGISSSIGDEIKRLQTELIGQRAKFQAFISTNNMPFWTEQAKQAAEYLAGLKTRQAALQTDLQRLKNLTPDQLLNAPPVQVVPRAPGGAAEQRRERADGRRPVHASTSSGRRNSARRRLASMSARKIWKPKHPRMQALKEQVADIQRSIDLIKQQNREASAQRKDAIKAELRSLDQSIATWDQKILESSSKGRRVPESRGRREADRGVDRETADQYGHERQSRREPRHFHHPSAGHRRDRDPAWPGQAAHDRAVRRGGHRHRPAAPARSRRMTG